MFLEGFILYLAKLFFVIAQDIGDGIGLLFDLIASATTSTIGLLDIAATNGYTNPKQTLLEGRKNALYDFFVSGARANVMRP